MSTARTTLRPILALTLAAALALPGCRALGTGAGTGALVGALVGGGAGYTIGRHNKHKSKGTAAGVLLGGLAGAYIGDQIEPNDRTRGYPDHAVEKTSYDTVPPLDDGRYRGSRPTVVRRTAPLPQRVRHRDTPTHRVVVRETRVVNDATYCSCGERVTIIRR